jgi:hypothetical protein
MSEVRGRHEDYMGIGEVVKLMYDIFGGLCLYHIGFAVVSWGNGFGCYTRVVAMGSFFLRCSGCNTERSGCVADDNRTCEVSSGV